MIVDRQILVLGPNGLIRTIAGTGVLWFSGSRSRRRRPASPIQGVAVR